MASDNGIDRTHPPPLLSGQVEPAWIDYNSHMTEARYLHVFSLASDNLLAMIGVGRDYVAGGHSFYTAETHLIHQRELREGEAFTVRGQILAADEKRLHIWQTLHRAADDSQAASCEQMLLHVDTKAGRTAPIGPAMRARLDAILAEHATLARPAAIGRAIGMKRVRDSGGA